MWQNQTLTYSPFFFSVRKLILSIVYVGNQVSNGLFTSTQAGQLSADVEGNDSAAG